MAKRKQETVLSVLKEIRDYLKPTDAKSVKCVHITNQAYIIETPPSRYTKLPKGWIRDEKTGLEWGPSSAKAMNWQEAKAFCKELGGRLPTVRELESLVDRTKSDPAIDKDVFPDTRSAWYWTSVEVAGDPGGAWCVYFGYGYVSWHVKGYDGYVRPVRASQ